MLFVTSIDINSSFSIRKAIIITDSRGVFLEEKEEDQVISDW